MKEFTFTVPDEYPWIMLFVVILCIECFFTGYLAIVTRRLKHFSEDFMKQFEAEHKAAFGANSPRSTLGRGGFPDSGNGFYSEKLSYKDWFDFNNG